MMPYVEYRLRMQAAALRQLSQIGSMLVSQPNEKTALIIAQLRSEAGV